MQKNIMIVGIDLRVLPEDGSEGAGVAHAARFLTQELIATPVPWNWKLYAPVGAQVIAPSRSRGVINHAPTIQLPNASGFSLRRALKDSPSNFLFVPGGSIAPGLPIPAVPLVHDLAIFDHPEWFPQSWLRRQITTRLFRRGVRRAPLVFAVSRDTASHLERVFSVNADKIRVTHEGGDPALLSQVKEKKLFILALGTVEPRKNLPLLIRAWQEALPLCHEKLELVIAGREGWKCELPRIPGLRRLREVDDELKRELLLTAQMVAIPSLHEGFGLVALEAMQAGTALLASRAGAISEVVGSVGVLLDPFDQSAWREAIVRLANDEGERCRLAEAGRRRAAEFSWRKSAVIIIEALKDIEKLS